MEIKSYDEIIESLKEELDEKGKLRVEKAADLGYDILINTLAHYYGNFLNDVMFAFDSYKKNPKSEETQEYMKKARLGLKKFDKVIEILSNINKRELTVKTYGNGNGNEKGTFDLDELISKENSKENETKGEK